MIKDLINELKAIDERLAPNDIHFNCILANVSIIEFIYDDLKVEIDTSEVFIINSYDECKIVHHCLYDSESINNIDLIMLLYNNKDRITEIVLKYI